MLLPMSYSLPYWVMLHSMSYNAPSWASLLPFELCCCILLSYSAPCSAELHCILKSYAAPCWAIVHPIELHCILLSYAAPSVLRYAAPNWGTLYFSNLHSSNEICCTLWATMHLTELHCYLLGYTAPYWAVLHPSELRCILLSYAAPCWAMLHPAELYWTLWATVHHLLFYNLFKCRHVWHQVSTVTEWKRTLMLESVHTESTRMLRNWT